MSTMNEDEEIRIIGGANWHTPKKVEPVASEVKQPRKRTRKSLWMVGGLVVAAIVCVLFTAYYFYRQKYVYGFEYPISRSQQEVISALETEKDVAFVGVKRRQESYLGVPLKLYQIDGLHPEMMNGVPNLKDANVYFVTRNADYWKKSDEKKIIGDYIVAGKEQSRNSWRAGYFATVNGRTEIGIGRKSDMREYVLDHDGSMFRQLALVSGGIKCVSQYVLKGKVTRCAYARTENNELYYVESVQPETLYGFSDALIEFGFVDAIYITGGAQANLFYRSEDGAPHGNFVDDKPHTLVVWKKASK